MAVLVHRTEKHLRVMSDENAEVFRDENWILNPDLSNVHDVPSKYWHINGDIITEMTSEQKQAVDTEEVVQHRNEMAAVIENTNSFERAFALVILDEINALRTAQGLPVRTPRQLRRAVRAKLDI